MSSMSIGVTKWVQSEDESDPALEVTVPVVLPTGVRSKELTILVKEDEVLCIKYKDSVLVQWRLYGKVSSEVEWRAESADSVVVDLIKKDPTSWPCLINVPMRFDDKLLVTKAEFDMYVAREVKPLPPPESGKKDETPNAAAEGKGEDDEDLDKMLDDAVEEVHSSNTADLDPIVRAELRGMDEEEKEIRSKLLEVQQKVEAGGDEADEDVVNASKLLVQVEKMLACHLEIRELRSRPSTLANFLESVLLDIRKARLNVGEVSETETEAFDSDEERNMTAHELMTTGMQLLQQQDPQSLHFLRLAAIHHNHAISATVLFRIYSQLGSPIGAYFLIRRALDDSEPDAGTNLQVAEMIDRGVRHFPPVFGAALHFYQRAAQGGSVHAMMNVAQMFLRGSTTATMLSQSEREQNVDLAKFHAWMQQALNRGSGAAYFVKGSMHLRGEHGLPKSYAMAKDFMDRAKACQPEIARKVPQINQQLEKLRIEEEDATKAASSEGSAPSSPASATTAVAAPRASASTASPTIVAPPAAAPMTAAQRLAALEGSSAQPFAATTKTAPKKSAQHAASGARARAFWEGAAVVGIATFSIYTLAFPIRVRFLATFYDLVQMFLDTFHLGGGSSPTGLL